MIYPKLQNGATIGVTAPSSGVESALHPLLEQAKSRMTQRGYSVIVGETPWTQIQAKSAPAKLRAEELMNMLTDPEISAVIPPWGGELLIEILEYLDFEKMPPKWILGYSDISLLLLAITLKTGIATAHGVNLIDLRGEYSDNTTKMWEDVLKVNERAAVTQYSSEKYQKKWNFEHPSPCIYDLTEPTKWKILGGQEKAAFNGRLLGGCIDVIRHLAGTPYGLVKEFREHYTNGEPIAWYFENCEMTTVDLRRSLIQLKYAGWFEDCSGILFGRSEANQPVNNYTAEEVYQDLANELRIPIIYNIDCGHVPPQMTFVNGAYAEIQVLDGKGTIKQAFC